LKRRVSTSLKVKRLRHVVVRCASPLCRYQINQWCTVRNIFGLLKSCKAGEMVMVQSFDLAAPDFRIPSTLNSERAR
jgi:hypothetical protein